MIFVSGVKCQIGRSVRNPMSPYHQSIIQPKARQTSARLEKVGFMYLLFVLFIV